ncbi:MAG: PQQ-binding-like beta-propeller repeat protein [Myxococcales bacterium]|nr:PQQ-binding-like beta-propeller repeat protein [Myxococcales bacterium]
MTTQPPRRLGLLLLALALTACGGGASFDTRFPDNRASDLDAVLSRLGRPSAAPPVAALLTTEPKLVLVGLPDGAIRWSEPVVSPLSAPHIAGDYVILHEQRGVVVRDLATGATRTTLPDDAMHLAGADGEGALAALVLSTGGGVGARSRLVVLDRGSVRWKRNLEQAVGAPAVASGLVFVPWATQNLSVLDAGGTELARLRLADSPVGHALRAGGDVFFGQRAVTRVGPRAVAGTAEGTGAYVPPSQPIPGDPAFLIDPYRPAPAPSNAVHRLRYAWRPVSAGDATALADGNLYVLFYRFVFALDAASGTVRWAHEHGQDVVGLDVIEGGVVVVDAAGGLHRLDASDGTTRWSAQVAGVSPVVAVVRADGVPAGGAPQEAALSLEDQLLAAALSTDARLVPARIFAVGALAAMPGDGVTRNLISICDDPQAPPTVRRAGCDALAERSEGAEEVLRALGRHARYLEGTTAPPVGALARAAVRMQERRAVPLLIAHLRDPETPAADLVALADALAALGAREAVVPLTDFLRLYHADGESDALTAGLGAVARALVRLQGPAAEETLREVQRDELAPEAVRGLMGQALSMLEEPAEEAPPSVEATDADDDAPAASGAPGLPPHTSAQAVEAALADAMGPLRACLGGANAASARLVLDLRGDGTLLGVTVAPATLQECIEPLVRSAQFLGNRRNAREQVRYTLRR